MLTGAVTRHVGLGTLIRNMVSSSEKMKLKDELLEVIGYDTECLSAKRSQH